MTVLDAVLMEGKSAVRALAIRKGSEIAQDHLPGMARRLAAADAAGPTFSTGAVAVIGGTLFVGGVALGFLAHDLFQGKKR